MFFIDDPKYNCVTGDGCNLNFGSGKFDSVLNIQVLEHVFEPKKMFSESIRVLKKGGYALFLVPQTAVVHELPHHYCNFTAFWLKEAARRSNVQIVELIPLGGMFSTMASHMVYFYFQALRCSGYSSTLYKRNIFFYLLLPFMLVYVLINIPLCLLFSLGDLSENANNHLCIVKKNDA